jgi:hypothetical protein
MTFSIEIVKEGFMSKKYAFPGRTTYSNNVIKGGLFGGI